MLFNYTLMNLTNLNKNVDSTIPSILPSGMAYTSDVFFLSNDVFQLFGLNNIKNHSNVFHKPRPVFLMTIKAFFPFLFIFLITLGKWLTETSSFCHINIKFKYLFLKSRRRLRKQHICFVSQKVFLFLLVAFTFDAKVPSKTQHDMNNAVNRDHELFTNQYFAVTDILYQIVFSFYALSKLKFTKHYWYFKYLLILSGDINLHPGPIQYPCSVCAKPG